jgi:arylsulfatase A-like enzyme
MGAAQETAAPPNVLLVLTDDQDMASLGHMDKLQEQLVAQGTSFSNAFATVPLCCPSRASLLRGQYGHNHGVANNRRGWQTFRNSGKEADTVATWLHDAGYFTGYVGKYLNGYGEGSTTTYIPPGWDRWYGFQGYPKEYYPQYRVNENGDIAFYRYDRRNDTDYFHDKAEVFLEERGSGGQPWFLTVATNAPHAPAFAPARHQDLYGNLDLPKRPSFNEADVSDKPNFVRNTPRLSSGDVKELEDRYRQRLRSLQAVDDLVGNLVNVLRDTGQLENTYIIFTTDNGYLQGEHRLRGKWAPYEESIGVPLVIRGPGVPQGASEGKLVSLMDLAPTMAGWTGAQAPHYVDGRSLAPLFSGTSKWRSRLLFELNEPQFNHRPVFAGVRTWDGQVYVEYDNGEKEYYDLARDPYQLSSQPASAPQGLQDSLAALKTCASAGCRAAENAPLP